MTDPKDLDIEAVFAYLDDPEVEFVDAAVDYNAPHGVNLPEEMDVE